MPARDGGAEFPGSGDALARRQAALVAALTGTGPNPPGFSERHVEVARMALLRKRARALRFGWPVLVESLGERLVPLFAQFAARRPTRGVLVDGHDFAMWLRERGELPGAADLELARARAVQNFDSGFDSEGVVSPRLDRFAREPFDGGQVVRVGRRVFVVGQPRVGGGS